ncbi:REP-associated tyrosine transposase [Legionella sp. CNM-4043-24]|uniref:REP-associated tyrosine transposase n=1 Tax=Legionella sp. CNM-4043-24 TaxID=3421646 RepID=UPI00403AC481
MSDYHRLFIKGGTYFFTVVTHDRQPLLCEEPTLTRLKAAFRYVMNKHPYHMDGLVVLPDHLHCIWRLPENDHDFSVRWNLFKRYFSIGMDSPTRAC